MDIAATGVGAGSREAFTRPTTPRRMLAREGCLELLAPGGHGRVAATMRAVPVIIPVCFTLFGEDVIFSPGGDEGLSRAVQDSVVAFETDQVGADGRPMWDVHVTGVARSFGAGTRQPDFRLSTELITGWSASAEA